MLVSRLLSVVVPLVVTVALSGQAQSVPVPPLAPATGARPVPGPVYEIPGFTDAVKRGTRTRTGEPGARNWVQHARYDIDASIDVATQPRLGARAGGLPQQLARHAARLAVYLRQNAFAGGSRAQPTAPITGGVTLGRVAVNGTEMAAHSSGVNVVPITSSRTRRGRRAAATRSTGP